MGMYTKIFVDVNFKENLPNDVILALKIMVGDLDLVYYSRSDLPNHKLFDTTRWDFMLQCSSYYHTPFSLSKLHYDDIAKSYYLTSSSDFKNYNNEVDLFFDFISKYVENGFLGYSLYEEDEVPTLYFLNPCGKIVKHISILENM